MIGRAPSKVVDVGSKAYDGKLSVIKGTLIKYRRVVELCKSSYVYAVLECCDVAGYYFHVEMFTYVNMTKLLAFCSIAIEFDRVPGRLRAVCLQLTDRTIFLDKLYTNFLQVKRKTENQTPHFMCTLIVYKMM